MALGRVSRCLISQYVGVITLIILDDVDTSETGHSLNGNGAIHIVSVIYSSPVSRQQLTREHDV